MNQATSPCHSLGQRVRSCLCWDLTVFSLRYLAPPYSLLHMLLWTKPSGVKLLPPGKAIQARSFLCPGDWSKLAIRSIGCSVGCFLKQLYYSTPYFSHGCTFWALSLHPAFKEKSLIPFKASPSLDSSILYWIVSNAHPPPGDVLMALRTFYYNKLHSWRELRC